MKTILFPTDFSDAATRAFIYSLHLARKLEARIITLHVFQKPDISNLLHVPQQLEELYNTIDLYEFENFRDAVPALDKLQKEKGFTDINVVHTIREGKTVPTIIEQAQKEEVDLIVMGTTGARGLKEIILGSVAGEVLENAFCPVLSVPEQAVFDGRIDHIAFTVSYKEEEHRALRFLTEFFAPFDPQIYCVNVDLAHTASYTHRMDEFSANYTDKTNVHFDVLDGIDLQDTLTNYLQAKQVDVLAMVTHKRGFLEELFTYSRTKAMSYHSQTPVLSFPADILENLQ